MSKIKDWRLGEAVTFPSPNPAELGLEFRFELTVQVLRRLNGDTNAQFNRRATTHITEFLSQKWAMAEADPPTYKDKDLGFSA